jgi:hypothetical protein
LALCKVYNLAGEAARAVDAALLIGNLELAINYAYQEVKTNPKRKIWL